MRILWALFGNDDDGVDASGPQARHLRPELTGWKRKIWWWFRNPFHNLTFYVIGFAKQGGGLRDGYVRIGIFPEQNLPAGIGVWNVCFIVTPSMWHFPFIARKGKKGEWYFGWRERGNFGITIRRRK